jgi:DNA-binding MarR family transcriptional regulator
METEKRQPFFVFYIIDYPENLSNIEIQILNRVYSFVRTNQKYYESASNLGDILHLSDRAVRNNINTLIEKNYLIKEIKDESQRFLYITEKTKQLFGNLGGLNDVQGGYEYNSGGGLNDVQGGYESNSAYSKDIIKIDNKDNITVTANASTTPSEVKPSIKSTKLTVEQVGDHFKDHLSLKSILDYFNFRKEIKKPIRTLKQIELNLEKFNKDFDKVVEQSIRNGWQGLFPLKVENQTTNKEWQIKKDIEPKTIILFNDLLFSKFDPIKFETICKETELKQELKTFCRARNISNKKELNDYFIAIDSDNSPLYFKRLSDFTSSLTNFAVKKELAVQN